MSLKQMENLQGGSPESVICNGLMIGWGGVLAYGIALSGVTAGMSAGVAVVWGGLSWLICGGIE